MHPKRRSDRSFRWLLLFTVVYLGWTVALARWKRLWFDEIVTVSIARLAGPGEIWNALRGAADGNPPLSYLLVHPLLTFWDDAAWMTRLPSIGGFWLAVLCLYGFVARRCGSAYGWLALLVPLATGAAPYAYEARPFGLALAFSALALVAWQAVPGAGATRWLGLLGMGLGLVGAVSSHYYAVLTFVPIALGEVARSVERRRVDVLVWLMLGIGALPLPFYLPLIQPLREIYSENFWSKPHPFSIPATYLELFENLLLAFVLVSLVFGWRWKRIPKHDTEATAAPTTSHAPPWPETVAAVGFLGLPIVAFLLALTVTDAYTERYVLASTFGASILLAFSAHWLGRGRPELAKRFVGILLGTVVISQAWDVQRERERFAPPAQLLRPIGVVPDSNLPVVVCNPDLYLQLVHYGPTSLQPRLVYLSGKDNTAELILEQLQSWVPLNVKPVQSLGELRSGERVVLYGKPNDWLLRFLVAQRLPVTLLYVDETWFVGTLEIP